MKDTIDRLHDKVDRIDDKLDKVDTHLSVYNEQLKIHIKRTEILESDVSPIKDHVAQVSGALKLIGAVATVFTIVVAIRQFL